MFPGDVIRGFAARQFAPRIPYNPRDTRLLTAGLLRAGIDLAQAAPTPNPTPSGGAIKAFVGHTGIAAAVIFTNGILLLVGGLLVAVPVVLHLVMQPRPRPVPFPAIQFLVQSQASTSRQLRLKHWLLLAARCLAIAIPALALAGPSVAEPSAAAWYAAGITGGLAGLAGAALAAAWYLRRGAGLLGLLAVLFIGALAWFIAAMTAAVRSDSATIIGRQEEPVTAILIVDNSPRMGYRRENRTHLEAAIEHGHWLVGLLPPDSQIAILDTAGGEAFYSVDLGAAQRRLDSLAIHCVQAGIGNALRAASELLEGAVHSRREVYVLTDLAAAAWEGVPAGAAVPAGTGLFLFDLGAPNPVNLWLGNLRPESVRLAGSSSLAVEVPVNAVGAGGERIVELRIEEPDPSRPVLRDGKVLLPERFWSVRQPVELPENGGASVILRFEQPLPPGIHHGTVSLAGSDALAADNIRFFTVSVETRWRLLVVCGPGVNPANVTSTLVPPLWETTVITQSEAGTIDPGQFDAVVWLDPGPCVESEWERIERYASDGGGFAVFLGANAVQTGSPHPAFLCEPAQRVLGGRLTLPWSRPADDPVWLVPQRLEHPLFAESRRFENALAWNRFPVRGFWGIETDFGEGQPGEVLIRFPGGEPALLERIIGKGRALVMTTPVTEPSVPAGRGAWNHLFVGSPFPAWMLIRGIGQYLVQARSETLNITVGETARLRNDIRFHPESYVLFTPDPRRPPSNVSARRGELRWSSTDLPGQYRLKGGGETSVRRGFSVNLDAAATDLQRLGPEQLDALLGPGQYRLARDRSGFERLQGASRRGVGFYPLLLIVLAGILAIESLLSSRFYGRGNSAAASPIPTGLKA